VAAAIFGGAWSLLQAGTSAGQLTLPDAQITLPAGGLTPAVDASLPVVGLRVDARRLRLDALLAGHRAELERDPRGELIVRAEILAFGLTADALQRAQAAGFVVLRQRVLDGLDATLVVLQPPSGLSMRRALQQLRELDPAGSYDFNHIYVESGEAVAAAGAGPGAHEAASTQGHPAAIRVGLIDGGVVDTHPAFTAAKVEPHGCEGVAVPTLHGTAVASLLLETIRKAPAAQQRDVQLFAADVYCGAATGGAVDAVVDALAWMSAQHVPVVNVSLVGPSNVLLERAITLVTARGLTVVAAVGNDGPAAAPLYPAAYADVVAVTAVDRQHKVLLEACRGPFVDFAATGADVSAAAPPDGVAPVRGTSFAAPVVAGLLAVRLDRPDRASAADAVRALAQTAVDLGARGPDPVYGQGLVGAVP
jgi:hypothetical protein